MIQGISTATDTLAIVCDAESVADTARLLKLRGQAMQRAVPVGEGAMAVRLVHQHLALR